MESSFISVNNGNFHVIKWGNGGKLLIAIHGYGVEAQIFAPIAEALKDTFTIYAIDLPFHGQTTWRNEKYQRSDILEIINSILEKESKDTCSILANSFGARIALALTATIPERIEHLFLISPDGIYTHWLPLGFMIPKKFRPWIMHRFRQSARLLQFAAWLRWRGIIPSYVEIFIRKNMSSPDNQARLLGTWLSVDSFTFDMKSIQKILNEAKIPMDLVMGKDDPMLDHTAIQIFIGNINLAKLHEVMGSHKINSQEMIAIINQAITASPERP